MANDIELLRSQAAIFANVMRELESAGPAAKLDRATFARWQKLVTDGRGIRAGIETATRLIDGGQKWVNRTFQVDAVEAIPFAQDAIDGVTRGALSGIAHWLEQVKEFLPAIQKASAQLAALPEEERDKLSTAPVTVPATNGKAGLMLVLALGALVWIAHKSDLPEFFEGD